MAYYIQGRLIQQSFVLGHNKKSHAKDEDVKKKSVGILDAEKERKIQGEKKEVKSKTGDIKCWKIIYYINVETETRAVLNAVKKIATADTVVI